jgi:hypothetical protein
VARDYSARDSCLEYESVNLIPLLPVASTKLSVQGLRRRYLKGSLHHFGVGHRSGKWIVGGRQQQKTRVAKGH